MMRIRLDINGRDIGEIGVHNSQVFDGYEVRYDIYDMSIDEDVRHLTDYPKLGEVWHYRSHGAASLTEKVFEEIGEEPLDDPRDDYE